MGNRAPEPLSNLEYHVLLALAAGALYGYAIKEAVADESGGRQAVPTTCLNSPTPYPNPIPRWATPVTSTMGSKAG